MTIQLDDGYGLNLPLAFASALGTGFYRDQTTDDWLFFVDGSNNFSIHKDGTASVRNGLFVGGPITGGSLVLSSGMSASGPISASSATISGNVAASGSVGCSTLRVSGPASVGSLQTFGPVMGLGGLNSSLITNGSNTVTVSGLNLPFTPTMALCGIMKDTGTNDNIWGCIPKDTLGSNGFTAYFTSAVPTGNYSVVYLLK